MIPNRQDHLFRLPLAALLVGMLAACASVSPPTVQRGADPLVVDAPAGTGHADAGNDVASTGPQPVIRRGTGQVIDRAAAAAPVRNLPDRSSATTGSARVSHRSWRSSV